MGNIKLLEKHVSELIAAGEVIERPASIVKELLENAIDAKATAITVEIKRGGTESIRITDNGIGMEKEDIPLAFLRHATSKVRTQADLEHIATLGFRGEALASIAAVAKVELFSKTAQEPMGSHIVIRAGETISFDDAGCPNGTTLMIKDLFYHLPARRKFLKKDSSEASAIQSIVEKIAISHTEISFKFVKDQKIVLHTAGDNRLLSGIHAIFGREFATSLIEVNHQHEKITVTGYISKPNQCRNNRSMQHFFINERYVKSKLCSQSLEEAYQNAIMTSKFPACILMISLDYTQVDVNVHPSKTEVKFVDEKAVFEAIYSAVKTALSEMEHFTNLQSTPEKLEKLIEVSSVPTEQSVVEVLPNLSTENTTELRSQPSNGIVHRVKPHSRSLNRSSQSKSSNQNDFQTVLNDRFRFLNAASFQKKSTVQPTKSVIEKPTKPAISVHIIGELFKTYILCEVQDGFVMLDKHAAHERIIFDRLKKELSLNEGQVLLNPLIIYLSIEEFDIVQSHLEIFEQYGFQFELLSGCRISVKEAPSILHRLDLTEIIQDMIENILEHKMEVTPKAFEHLLHSMACKSAIKANDNTSTEELAQLVKQVYQKQIKHCPHGRPVGIVLSKYEIEKKFGRHS